ncbi:AprI/Inh family metalloprotease inhibitor [Rhizobiaceae sp. 2RAB30]
MHSICRFVIAVAVVAGLQGSALAQGAQPMDIDAVDQQSLKEFYGSWEILDESGKKTCRIVLKPDQTIGGSEIEIDPACVASFPVMEDITAWRLMQGWGIDLVDTERKTRISFFTPDNAYVAQPDTDGIFTIEQR